MTYNMKHTFRGKCIIFNNKCFDIHTRLNERRGTEVDAKALYGCFRSLDFDVLTYNDPSAKDITSILDSGIHFFNYLLFVNLLISSIPVIVLNTDKQVHQGGGVHPLESLKTGSHPRCS